MTQEEAISLIAVEVIECLDKVENLERLKEFNTGYEGLKKTLDAYLFILGKINPELSTREGLKKNYHLRNKSLPDLIETESYKLLKEWQTYNPNIHFKLTKQDIKDLVELSKLPDEFGCNWCSELSERSMDSDSYLFIYNGEVYISAIYIIDHSDCLSSFSPQFKEKILEIIRACRYEQ